MATNTQKTVDEQLTDIRSELDKIKLYITNSITGITTSVNRVSTDVENKLTATDLAGINAKIETIEASLVEHANSIADMEEEHIGLNKYEKEIEDLLAEVKDVKDKTTSGLAKLSEAINNSQSTIESKVGEVLDTLGINDELKNSIDNALNSANAMKEEVLGVIYTQHPELNISATLTAHNLDGSSRTQYTVGTVPEGGIQYYVKISLSRALGAGEKLTDGSGVDLPSDSKVNPTEYRMPHTISYGDVADKSHTYKVVTNYNTVSKTVSIKRAYRTYNFMYGGDEEALIGAINGKSGAELEVVEGCVGVREVANTTANGTQTISAGSSVDGGEKYLYYLVPTDMGNSGSLTMVQSGQNGSIGTKAASTVSINGIDHHIYKSNQKMGKHPEIKLQ